MRTSRRWLRRTQSLVVALVLAWMLPWGTAAAETGRPAGWQVSDATAEVVIGRVELRYDPALEDEALELAEAIPLWWSQIEQALAGDVQDHLRITFVDHAGRVAEATHMPRWVAGVAHPSTGEIVVARHGPDGARTDLPKLVKHEMAHVALHRATGGAPLPRWFHEGVAESFTDEISLRRAETLAAAVFGPGVPDLRAMERSFHGAEGQQAAVAYAAARDLVTHLRYWDPEGAQFRQLLTELRLDHGFEASFIRAYDLALPELVQHWRAGLQGRFVWYALAGSGGLPFALVLPLVTWAWIRRKRVLRASWERLEQEDAAIHGLEPLPAG